MLFSKRGRIKEGVLFHKKGRIKERSSKNEGLRKGYSSPRKEYSLIFRENYSSFFKKRLRKKRAKKRISFSFLKEENAQEFFILFF